MFVAESREDFPAVGDWVSIKELDNECAVIYAVLPRKTIIKRKYGDKNKAGEKNATQIIATNIDVAFVVESIDRDYSLNRFERYFAIARDGGVKPAIILNKIDLISKEELNEKLAELRSRFTDLTVIPTSIVNNEGLDELEKCIVSGKTYCFLGSSGVGKSSLINKLLGKTVVKTGNISLYSDRGKHITTSRQMYFLENGGIVIDNPGMREVGMTDVREGIDSFFDEIIALAEKCKYADCTHTHESGCEILAAVESGKLDEEKYSNYIGLKKEAEYYEMNEVEKREKDRQFGKYIKKAQKELKTFKDKY
jgi:ribosome biogenesis GTPase